MFVGMNAGPDFKITLIWFDISLAAESLPFVVLILTSAFAGFSVKARVRCQASIRVSSLHMLALRVLPFPTPWQLFESVPKLLLLGLPCLALRSS